MKLGFIGTGNMASAIMGGIIKNQIIPANDIIGADVDGIMAKAKSEIEVWLALNSHNRPTKET